MPAATRPFFAKPNRVDGAVVVIVIASSYVAARWRQYDPAVVGAAVRRATGNG